MSLRRTAKAAGELANVPAGTVDGAPQRGTRVREETGQDEIL
jgi:hypothetical protein